MTVASEKLDPIQRLFVDITTDVLCQTNSGVLRLNIYTIINCCPARYKDVSSLSKEDRGLVDFTAKCLSCLSSTMESCFVELPMSSKITKAIFLLKSITPDLKESLLLRSAAYKFAADSYSKIKPSC